MKFYLSSYHLGNETAKLRSLIAQTNGKFGYIPNAADFKTADPQKAQADDQANIADLQSQGAQVEKLDLKDYFGKKEALRQKLRELGGVYVRGGNTFILRQAAKLSGLDELILEMQPKDDFLYIAYSAGCCMLSPDLKVYAMTDDANDFPYDGIKEQTWEGLGILPFTFEPHYDSDHAESESTEKEIRHLIDNKTLFKAYRDGEVLILE